LSLKIPTNQVKRQDRAHERKPQGRQPRKRRE
jgi:hypothetical protein